MRMNVIRLLFVLILLPGCARADERVLDIREVTSPGGITAWLVEDHSVPVISLKFGFTGAGASLDPADKQGLSRMLSNTMDEGAGDLDSQSFQKELLDLSISLSFGSDRDNFSGSLKTLTANKARAFELLSMALTKPRFDEEPVNRMRAANQSRIRSSLSDPEWMAARLMNDRAFSGHVYAQNSGGTLSSLDAITPDDLRKFHQSYLGKNNLVVAVAGDINPAELKTVLDKIFSGLPEKSEIPAIQDAALQNEGATALYRQDIPQTIIEMMQPGISRKDKDFQKAQVMNFILGSSGFGSRLTQEIREKRGLTYGIYSSFDNMTHFASLSVSTSTKNESVPELLGLVKAEWEKMKTAPVNQQELDDAKSYLTGSLPLSLTSTDAIAGLMLSLELDGMPVNYLDTRQKEIESTTVEDVQNVARRLLDMAKMTIVLVGNPPEMPDVKIVEDLPNAE